ncbi:MAG: hypothetical protein A2W23_02610 [Planctomycetes bacterium RBG_16_43_13]|nr:MAG: hypothetical protein A2W23_02610 [Planctomycetes bacterium RBG_16_43_13]
MFNNKLEFKGAVIGTLLGDACIPTPTRKITCHLQLSHKKADEEYLNMKVNMLRYLTEVTVKEYDQKLDDKIYPQVSARTRSHPFYNSIYDHMYYQGRKTVDEHVLKCLTPLGLALWYFDDGTLAGEMGWRNPYICSHNFNKIENELLCRMVHKRFGVTFRTVKKNIKDKTYYWMRLRRKDREKFLNIVAPFAPQCMRRKIDPLFYENDEKYREEHEMSCEICSKSFIANTHSIAKNCKECNQKILRQEHRFHYDTLAKQRVSKCIQCDKTFEKRPGKKTVHCSRKCSGKSHSSFWENKRSNQAIA